MMLDGQTYASFVVAVVVLCVIPGPDMAYLLGRTVTQGRRAGVVAALGINTGGYAHVAATVLGLSAILAASSVAFTLVKLIGAGYLVWIGIRTFASASKVRNPGDFAAQPTRLRRVFFEGFLSDALNPKVSLFFLVFLPQFVDRTLDVAIPLQLLLLGVACNVIALGINLLLVLLASRVSSSLRECGGVRRWLDRCVGGLFIALGFRLASQ
jgi:threonine/homoserine/homoserine lactone efflux protein